MTVQTDYVDAIRCNPAVRGRSPSTEHHRVWNLRHIIENHHSHHSCSSKYERCVRDSIAYSSRTMVVEKADCISNRD